MPPIPRSISPAAQAYLAAPPAQRPPPAADLPAWRRHIESVNRATEATLSAALADIPVTVETVLMGGVTVFDAVPKTLVPAAVGKTVVYFHGGGLALFAGPVGAAYAKREALRLGCRVMSIDYRVAPDDPYPAGLDDCAAVYAHLLEQQPAKSIAFYGVSGGANLALATCFRARQADLPLPAGLALVSPQIDMTESGDSFETNRELDAALRYGATHFNDLYAGGRDRTDPMISPLFGDFSGFPPTHIQSGTRDLMLSNAVRLHQRMRGVGVPADLYLLEAGVHGGFDGDSPEDREARRQIGVRIARFLSA